MRVLFLLAILTFWGGVMPRSVATRLSAQTCTPETPLHLAVLVDHSTSVFREDRSFRGNIFPWINDALDLLRPGDRMEVFEFPGEEHGSLLPLLTFDVPRPPGSASDEAIAIRRGAGR